MKRSARRDGFSVVELLVVFAVISVLLAMLLPALQGARETARRMSCLNNLKQLTLGLYNYESSQKRFPAPCLVSTTEESHGFSAHARLLGYLEQHYLDSQIDYSASVDDQVHLVSQLIPMFVCPSESNDRYRFIQSLPYRQRGEYGGVNYGASCGTWFQFDPNTGAAGDGAFAVNRMLAAGDFEDGLSNTVGFAEVKAFQACVADGLNPSALKAAVPRSVQEVSSLGGVLYREFGHGLWLSGDTLETGVTHTFAPNTFSPFSQDEPQTDCDFSSSLLGAGTGDPTYAIVTSRSYHPGGVNVGLMDGSVRFVRSSVDLKIWQAYGTRAGNEMVGQLELSR